jgi:hypothetical protein
MLKRIVVGLLMVALPLAALATATVRSIRGDAQAAGAALAQGQAVNPPTAITTGPGAQVFLKFQDDMEIVLGENSLLRIIDFRHTASGVTDRAVFELLRGSARVVTGRVAHTNPTQFFFRTPQTQLTVERASDFTVALVNPAYIAVKSGAVVSSNGWGSMTLGAGSTTAVAGNAAAPAAIAGSAMPGGASSAMTTLAQATTGAPATTGGAASGTVATGGAATASGFAIPIVAGVVVVGVAAAVASDSDEPAQQTTTSHH